MSKARGVFISFESIDGLGKTTQVLRLKEALHRHGYDVVLRKEPGSANVGSGIRDLLFKDPTTKQMSPGVADALFLADHIQNAADIEKFVTEGKVVICDRYADSQFAYAGSKGKNCPEWALDAYTAAFGLVPDITVLMVARGPKTFKDSGKILTEEEARMCRQVFIEDIGWALYRAQQRRGVEAGKQDGKAWNNVEDQLLIQEEYLKNIGDLERTVIIEVREQDTIEAVSDRILNALAERSVLHAAHPEARAAYEAIAQRLIPVGVAA